MRTSLLNGTVFFFCCIEKFILYYKKRSAGTQRGDVEDVTIKTRHSRRIPQVGSLLKVVYTTFCKWYILIRKEIEVYIYYF